MKCAKHREMFGVALTSWISDVGYDVTTHPVQLDGSSLCILGVSVVGGTQPSEPMNFTVFNLLNCVKSLSGVQSFNLSCVLLSIGSWESMAALSGHPHVTAEVESFWLATAAPSHRD